MSKGSGTISASRGSQKSFTQEQKYRIGKMLTYLEAEVMPKVTQNKELFRQTAKEYIESISDYGMEYQAFTHSDARGLILTVGKYLLNKKK